MMLLWLLVMMLHVMGWKLLLRQLVVLLPVRMMHDGHAGHSLTGGAVVDRQVRAGDD
jgi:hypothetical protein